MTDLTDPKDTFVSLLTQFQPNLRAYVRSLVPQHAEAEELLQNINLYLWQHSGDFQIGTNFLAWAMSVAHFLVISWRRDKSRDPLIFDDELFAKLEPAAQIAAMGVGRHEAALHHCMEKLSGSDRKLVGLRYEHGLSAREIAEQTGRSFKALYATFTRIHSRLLECIQRTLAAEDSSL